jgi:bifunctional UDP-N-acetylglucosamine pyrophosphorylase/glucosamine-1-phosphate N-acetyltransferase
MVERPLAAVVLAAGRGTRMRSELPKALHPLLGMPMLEHPLLRVLELSAAPVIVVVGYQGAQVEAAFAPLADRVTFVTQAEQLGTGHAALQARAALEAFDGDVLILPGDCPLIRASTLKAFVAEHRASGATLTLLTTRLADPAHYGRVVRDVDGGLARIVEARDADDHVRAIQEINSGIYLVDARFLFSALARVGNRNAQGEYYLTDIVGLGREEGVRLCACLHPDFDELAGVNDRLELAQAEARLRGEINRRHMAAGVTLEDPVSIRIEPGVRIEPDVILGAGVQLRGDCRIARGCRLEPGVLLTGVTLGPDVVVGAYSVLRGVGLEAGSRVAPMTRLEPG